MCNTDKVTITGDHFRYGHSEDYRGHGKAERHFTIHIDYGTFLDKYAPATKGLIRQEFTSSLVRTFQPNKELGCIFVQLFDEGCKLYIAARRGNKAYFCTDEYMNRQADQCFDHLCAAIEKTKDCPCDPEWRKLTSVNREDLDFDAMHHHRRAFADKENKVAGSCKLCRRDWYGRY